MEQERCALRKSAEAALLKGGFRTCEGLLANGANASIRRPALLYLPAT